MNAYTEVQLEYRIGSVSNNAVKALREVFGRDTGAWLDADIAAVKSIESILHNLPRESAYPDLEARAMVSAVQPDAHKSLEELRKSLAEKLDVKD